MGDMTDLPSVTPLPAVPPMAQPPVTDSDLRTVLQGLEPGWYSVRDLYPRMVALADRRGIAAPTKIQFGMALRAAGVENRNIRGHVRAWLVTDELAGRA
jgi:hypothetical protein